VLCAEYADDVLAIDLGNELSCLPDSAAASPAEVLRWIGDVTAAVRRAAPGALIVSGCDQSQINTDSGWRFGAQPGCDFYSMHSYPFPRWHTVRFDGMGDPLGRSLLPFYVKCARAFGPVLVQEFGTLLTAGRLECDRYLQHVLPACAAAGANGYLWWCLRDIAAVTHPYNKNGFEGSLGLVGSDGCVKPGLEFFPEFARSHVGSAAPRERVGLVWPEHYYDRDAPENPGNKPAILSRLLALSHHALESIRRDVVVVRSEALPAPESVDYLVIAGASLTILEVRRLRAWVELGGHLLWHGPDPLNWGTDMVALLGAAPIDFGARVEVSVSAGKRSWKLGAFPRDTFLRIELRGAHMRIAAPAGRAFVFEHRIGSGSVTTCLALPECAGDSSALASWYAHLLVSRASRQATT
jgi:hypothetical protein